jgi:hypothetical protein
MESKTVELDNLIASIKISSPHNQHAFHNSHNAIVHTLNSNDAIDSVTKLINAEVPIEKLCSYFDKSSRLMTISQARVLIKSLLDKKSYLAGVQTILSKLCPFADKNLNNEKFHHELVALFEELKLDSQVFLDLYITDIIYAQETDLCFQLREFYMEYFLSGYAHLTNSQCFLFLKNTHVLLRKGRLFDLIIEQIDEYDKELDFHIFSTWRAILQSITTSAVRLVAFFKHFEVHVMDGKFLIELMSTDFKNVNCKEIDDIFQHYIDYQVKVNTESINLNEPSALFDNMTLDLFEMCGFYEIRTLKHWFARFCVSTNCQMIKSFYFSDDDIIGAMTSYPAYFEKPHFICILMESFDFVVHLIELSIEANISHSFVKIALQMDFFSNVEFDLQKKLIDHIAKLGLDLNIEKKVSKQVKSYLTDRGYIEKIATIDTN